MSLHSCELLTSQGRTVLPFRLRRSRRNRYLRVSVRDNGEVLLSVPQYVNDSGALEFLRSQAEWLIRTIGRPPVQNPSILEHIQRQPWLSLDGHKAKVQLDSSKVRSHWVANPDHGETLIRCFTGENRSDELMRILVEMAKHYVPARVKTLAERLGLKIGGVQVRDQRTRWGSCSSNRNLSFNWRIILLPPRLHDHIIMHELAHLTHMDHSKRFYKLLAEYDPDSQANDHAISKISPVFMALGR